METRYNKSKKIKTPKNLNNKKNKRKLKNKNCSLNIPNVKPKK